jgi:hypothetical protein
LRDDLKKDFQKAQTTLLDRLDQQSATLRTIGLRQIRQTDKQKIGNLKAYFACLQIMPAHIDHFVQEVEKVVTSHRILQSLFVAEIGFREEQICEAYDTTFEWIFDDGDGIDNAHAYFQRWLYSSNEVFWVSGKAGSGKSTLMKYLADHKKTHQILRHWAGDAKLVIGKHFFWNAGSKIQKSHLGLVQGLLYQLLRQCPELIPFASFRRWEADESSAVYMESWTRAELAASLKSIIARGRLEARFCFFIDGLDEYADEAAGEHHELIEYLDLLARSGEVKLCVSSRPWTVFKDRYEGRHDLILVLQDLTSRDMYKYVKGMLENDQRFRRLVTREPQALDLVPQIRDKAEGVFLWVYLVVRSLLRGLAEHDDTLELERRLSMVPTDLNKYFLTIFKKIEPVYRREAMRAFQLASISMPLPLLVFKHLPKEVLDPRFACELTAEELKVSDSKAKNNVNKWCRDLLEIKESRNMLERLEIEYSSSVQFLHRTVKDFLLTHEMQTNFGSYPVCRSSPLQAMCMMFLAESKVECSGLSRSGHDRFKAHIDSVMEWARECEEIEDTTPTGALDELEKVRIMEMTLSRRQWLCGILSDSILHLAVGAGLCSYVSLCLDRDPEAKTGLLWCALPLYPKFRRSGTESASAMLTLLLEKGVDPNQSRPSGLTTWRYYLACCYADDKFNDSRWKIELAGPWIHHGADLDVEIASPREPDVRLSVRTCLLTDKGCWPGVDKVECERQVDEWLADGRARRAAGLFDHLPGSPMKTSPLPKTQPNPSGRPSFPSKMLSLRAKFKRLFS